MLSMIPSAFGADTAAYENLEADLDLHASKIRVCLIQGASASGPQFKGHLLNWSLTDRFVQQLPCETAKEPSH